MVQKAKFIDVTRSYLPIDPNAFPESLHLGSDESSPENHIPVMAYDGYNFLPTSYGYKSYFGVNRTAALTALVGRIDRVFVFQTPTYDNILIALCDNGIWYVSGTAGGNWIQALVIEPDADPQVHYEWTHTIISNELFCYQQGQGTYQQFTPTAAAPGFVMASVVPGFLNMEGQLGIFRAGGRLGFWDSAGSVSWSSLDDFSDFTPSVETLAGSSIFLAAIGPIVSIKEHGPGFIIYCTKSIVSVRSDPTATFQWNPLSLMNNSGIAYPEQVAVAIPDTVHFAYTTTGMVKIDSDNLTIIVPEVTDFLKEAQSPIYLKLLEGRFLCLEIIDGDYINGVTKFTDEIVDPVTYYFPGTQKTLLDAVDPSTLQPQNLCGAIAGLDNAAFPDTQPPSGTAADIKPGTFYQPLWTCYLSHRGGYPDDITWGSSPCPTIDPNGVEVNMCPVGNANLLNNMTSDSSHKTAVSGADAYIDGKWTMERFVQTQTAIWNQEQGALNAFLAKCQNRSKTVDKSTFTGSCVAVPVTRNECTIGRLAVEYSGAAFGFSACSFWLTRLATKAADLVRIKANHTTCGDRLNSGIQPTTYTAVVGGSIPGVTGTPAFIANHYGTGLSHTASLSTVGLSAPDIIGSPGPDGAAFSQSVYAVVFDDGYVPGSPIYIAAQYDAVPGFTYVSQGVTAPGSPPNVGNYPNGGRYEQKETMNAYNNLRAVPITPTPESPYCEITGWSYTATDGSTKTVAATGCTSPKSHGIDRDTNKSFTPTVATPVSDSGSMCGLPFEGATIPGTPAVTINWPDTSVTIPSGTFLLQVGSPAPVYPTFYGALVYDTYLKKWGKMKEQYKRLLDYSPINTASGPSIPYDRFGIVGGLMKSDGLLYLFDKYPLDTKITYGKIGYNRLGTTSVEEVIAQFRTPCSGFITVDSSLSGKHVTAGLSITQGYANTDLVNFEGGYPGVWHNITFSGMFDISYLEYRGFVNGRR